MQLLKRWHESEFFLAGQPVRLKLKALSFDEAPVFLRKMQEHAVKARKEDTDVFETLGPDFVRESFEKYVRPVGELEDEEGGKITTGRDLFLIANPGLVVAVLARLERLCVLTAPEGKVSFSPSMSESAAMNGGSVSPVTSTGPVDGLSP